MMKGDFILNKYYDLSASDEELINDFYNRISEALNLLTDFKETDGVHHKDWVLDQIARILTKEEYEDFIKHAKNGDDGPETYGWEEGIAP